MMNDELFDKRPDIELTFGKVLLDQIRLIQVLLNMGKYTELHSAIETLESCIYPYLPEEYYARKKELYENKYRWKLIRFSRSGDDSKYNIQFRLYNIELFRLMMFYLKSIGLLPQEQENNNVVTGIYRGDNIGSQL